MEFHVFSPNFERIGVIETYISSVWEENYRERGNFTLVVHDMPENIRLLQKGNRLWQRGKRTSMVLEHVKRESATNTVTVHGYTALNRLNQRIIWPALSVTNAEQGMRDIVLNNMRALERMVVQPTQGFTETFHTVFTGHELLDALNILAVESGLGYYAFFDPENKCDEFRVYRGADLSQDENAVVFKDEFGKLPNMITVDDSTLFKNVAYVVGAGEGEGHTVITIGEYTGDDRFELFVDARDIHPNEREGETYESPEFLQRLWARGVERLNERIHVQTFIAQVDAPNFGHDFYLGDEVICSSTRYGVTLKTRIIAYREIMENNIMRRELTFGLPEISALGELRITAHHRTVGPPGPPGIIDSMPAGHILGRLTESGDGVPENLTPNQARLLIGAEAEGSAAAVQANLDETNETLFSDGGYIDQFQNGIAENADNIQTHIEATGNVHHLVLGDIGAASADDVEQLEIALNTLTDEFNSLEYLADQVFNKETGVLTTYRSDGTTITAQFPNIVSNAYLDGGELIIEFGAGNEVRLDIAALIPVYTGSTGVHIQLVVTPQNELQAILRAGSVTNTELATMPAKTIKGRQAGTGPPQDLDAEQIRQMLNVEEGAGVTPPLPLSIINGGIGADNARAGAQNLIFVIGAANTDLNTLETTGVWGFSIAMGNTATNTPTTGFGSFFLFVQSRGVGHDQCVQTAFRRNAANSIWIRSKTGAASWTPWVHVNPPSQAPLNRTIGSNDNATGTVTDTGGDLSIPFAVEIPEDEESNSLPSAILQSARAFLRRMRANVRSLFSRVGAVETTHNTTPLAPPADTRSNEWPLGTRWYEIRGGLANGYPINWGFLYHSRGTGGTRLAIVQMCFERTSSNTPTTDTSTRMWRRSHRDSSTATGFTPWIEIARVQDIPTSPEDINAAPATHVGARGITQHALAGGADDTAGFSQANFTQAEKDKLHDIPEGGGVVEVIDNLTDTSAIAALSANMGRLLDEIKLSLAGGLMTGTIVLPVMGGSWIDTTGRLRADGSRRTPIHRIQAPVNHSASSVLSWADGLGNHYGLGNALNQDRTRLWVMHTAAQIEAGLNVAPIVLIGLNANHEVTLNGQVPTRPSDLQAITPSWRGFDVAGGRWLYIRTDIPTSTSDHIICFLRGFNVDNGNPVDTQISFRGASTGVVATASFSVHNKGWHFVNVRIFNDADDTWSIAVPTPLRRWRLLIEAYANADPNSFSNRTQINRVVSVTQPTTIEPTGANQLTVALARTFNYGTVLNRTRTIQVATANGNDNMSGESRANAVQTIAMALKLAGDHSNNIVLTINRNTTALPSAHAAATAYAVGDRCLWAGLLMEAVNANTGSTPSATNVNWRFVNAVGDDLHPGTIDRGIFNPDSLYAVSDVVRFTGSAANSREIAYVCKHVIAGNNGSWTAPTGNQLANRWWAPITAGNPFIAGNVTIANTTGLRIGSTDDANLIIGGNLTVSDNPMAWVSNRIVCNNFSANRVGVMHFESFQQFNVATFSRVGSAFYATTAHSHAGFVIGETAQLYFAGAVEIRTESPIRIPLSVTSSNVVFAAALTIDGNNRGATAADSVPAPNTANAIFSRRGARVMLAGGTGTSNITVNIRGFGGAAIRSEFGGEVEIRCLTLTIQRDALAAFGQNPQPAIGRCFHVERNGKLVLHENLQTINRNGAVDIFETNAEVWSSRPHVPDEVNMVRRDAAIVQSNLAYHTSNTTDAHGADQAATADSIARRSEGGALAIGAPRTGAAGNSDAVRRLDLEAMRAALELIINAISNEVDNLEYIAGFEWNETGGILKLIRKDDTYVDIHIPGIVSSAVLDGTDLVITFQGGASVRVPFGGLIPIYKGSTGAHIQIAIDPVTLEISAVLRAGTVTGDRLVKNIVLPGTPEIETDPAATANNSQGASTRWVRARLGELIIPPPPPSMSTLDGMLGTGTVDSVIRPSRLGEIIRAHAHVSYRTFGTGSNYTVRIPETQGVTSYQHGLRFLIQFHTSNLAGDVFLNMTIDGVALGERRLLIPIFLLPFAGWIVRNPNEGEIQAGSVWYVAVDFNDQTGITPTPIPPVFHLWPLPPPNFGPSLPLPLGEAALPGVSLDAARVDHVHQKPTAEQVGADPAGSSAAVQDELQEHIDSTSAHAPEDVGAAPAQHVHPPTDITGTALIASAGQLVPNGTDFNTIVTAGVYRIASAASAATMLNNPYTATNFRLEVTHSGNATHIIQTIYGARQGDTPRIWQRTVNGINAAQDNWGAWRHVILGQASNGAVRIADGGTGAVTAADALINLGADPAGSAAIVQDNLNTEVQNRINAIANEATQRIAAINAEAAARLAADNTLGNDIRAEATARAEAIAAEASARIADIAAINALIPTQATTSNQLADRDFVNSSIQNMAARYVTPTADGLSQWVSITALREGPWFYQGAAYTPTQTDYAIFINRDNTQWRAAFDGVQWNPTFQVQDRPFTADELAVLSSNITNAMVQRLIGAQAPTSGSDNFITSGQVFAALAERAPANQSLTAETGTGTNIDTPAVQSGTTNSILQRIWNWSRQMRNAFTGHVGARGTAHGTATPSIDFGGVIQPGEAGFLSSPDKEKLDRIEDGAQVNPLFGMPVALGIANAEGRASTSARSDHIHQLPDATDVGADPAGSAADVQSNLTTHESNLSNAHGAAQLPTADTIARRTTGGALMVGAPRLGALGSGDAVRRIDMDNAVAAVASGTAGSWNAATNTPAMPPVPTAEYAGRYWIVSANGTQFGINFRANDFLAVENGAWITLARQDQVLSVNAMMGEVILDADDVGAAPAQHVHPPTDITGTALIAEIGQIIPSGTDLNTLDSPGVHRSNNAANSASLINTPHTTSGFRLEVLQLGIVGNVTQLLYVSAVGAQRIFHRTRHSNVWSLWHRIISGPDGFVPINLGGTGAVTAADALINLGASSTEELIALDSTILTRHYTKTEVDGIITVTTSNLTTQLEMTATRFNMWLEGDASFVNVRNTAVKVDWLIASGTNDTNFTLSQRVFDLVRTNINFDGLVTHTQLSASGLASVNVHNVRYGAFPIMQFTSLETSPNIVFGVTQATPANFTLRATSLTLSATTVMVGNPLATDIPTQNTHIRAANSISLRAFDETGRIRFSVGETDTVEIFYGPDEPGWTRGIVPVRTNDIDLGYVTRRFANLFTVNVSATGLITTPELTATRADITILSASPEIETDPAASANNAQVPSTRWVRARISENAAPPLLSQAQAQSTTDTTAGLISGLRLWQSINTNAHTAVMASRNTIPNGTDFNTIVTVGVHRVTSAVNAATMFNNPYTSSNFRMIVEHAGSASHIIQTIIGVGAGDGRRIFLRSVNSINAAQDNWGAWRPLILGQASNGAVRIADGGTGATTAADARTNLGIDLLHLTVSSINTPPGNMLMIGNDPANTPMIEIKSSTTNLYASSSFSLRSPSMVFGIHNGNSNIFIGFPNNRISFFGAAPNAQHQGFRNISGNFTLQQVVERVNHISQILRDYGLIDPAQ